MARIIDLHFNDKDYVIEFTRESVKELFKLKQGVEEKDAFDGAVELIKIGLLAHHKNDMPDDEVITSWIFALGSDLEAFIKEMRNSIDETINAIKQDQQSKNLKWGVRK